MPSSQPKRGEGPFILEDSDGCSALSIPFRFITKYIFGHERYLPFLAHCIEHDESYWYGGTKMQRWEADLKLFYGVANSRGSNWTVVPYYAIASVMFVVARVMGSPHIHSPFRWMYREEYHPKLTYTKEATVKNETVKTRADSDMVKTILENPYTAPVAGSVSEAVEIFEEGADKTPPLLLTHNPDGV